MAAAARANKERHAYERQKARSRARSAREAAEGQDIGRIPPVQDPMRRAAAMGDFRTFAETYLSAMFYLPWSKNQLHVMPRIEATVLNGGRFAEAMPRGEGKTSLAEAAVLFTALVGRRQFITFIANTGADATDLMESLATEFEENPLLLADFPEVVYPIRCLEGTPNRAKGQKYEGLPTRIQWAKGKIVLPTIPGSRASGTILTATGIEGGKLRGQRHKLATGEAIRPDFLIIDDPQDDASAWSSTETRKRVAAIRAAVAGAGGPRRRLAAVLCCTVIRPGDLSDQFLDRDTHPDWHGERLPRLYRFPKNTKAWDEYGRLLREELGAGGDGSRTTRHYVKHQATLDAGGDVSWPARFDEGEASGLQHAMNLYITDPETFWAEFQNQPQPEDTGGVEALSPDAVAARLNGLKPGQVPTWAEHITAFIDVHDRVMYYAVTAWGLDFTGAVIDYGAYPDQHRRHFTYRDAKLTLRRKHQGIGKEEAVRLGLEAIATDLAGRIYQRQDGANLRVERLLVDRGYLPKVVELACRRVGEPMMPYLGRGITAKKAPIHAYRRQPGRRLGFYWWIPAPRESNADRHVIADVNYWKSFLRDRLTVGLATPGALTFYGKDARRHAMLAEHLTSEHGVTLRGPYGTVEEWGEPTADNHLLDAVVGTAVAASTLGCALPGTEPAATSAARRKGRVRLSDLQTRRKR